MKVMMCLASEYGFRCLESIDSIVDIVGIITTHKVFRIKSGTKRREMKNTVYRQLYLYAEKHQVPILEIERMNTENTVDFVKKHPAELMIVSGWYHLIKGNILHMFPKGVVGLHSSMLPKYRGGAPLVWQLINGEKKAGISLFYLDEGVDSGDIIAQKEISITREDTIKSLYDKIGTIGIGLLADYLPQIAEDRAPREKQENLSDADIWPQRSPEDGEIDWTQSPEQIRDFVRAQTRPYPGAYTYIGSKKVIIWDCDVEDMEEKTEKTADGEKQSD